MSFWNIFGSDEPEDDPDVLPMELRPVYENPHKVLGVEQDCSVGELRNAFRAASVQHCPFFVGQKRAKYSFQQVVLAYQLARGNLSGPAQTLNEALQTSRHYHRTTPEDVLPTLRPFNCAGVVVNKEYRGCKAFVVTYLEHEICFSTPGGSGVATGEDDPDLELPPAAAEAEARVLANRKPNAVAGADHGILPRTEYCFVINYGLRRSKVRRTDEQLERLHDALSKELLMLPGFPEATMFFSLGSTRAARGKELADYMQRVHDALASRGLFSPRLLQFLEVDFARVHSEEEGRIVCLLDSKNLIPGTMWHIVNEEWLMLWRKFVHGREARRYLPPGRISNYRLLMADGVTPKPDLELIKHYRAIVYNVWYYFYLVYGGGPNIPRRGKDVYSDVGMGYQEAVITAQCAIRKFLARSRFEKLYTAEFSKNALSAKLVIAELQQEAQDRAAAENLNAQRGARIEKRMSESVLFTQRVWRRRKNYEFKSESLQQLKHVQEVFARADQRVEGATGDHPLVVEDVNPIVHIGMTGDYVATFAEGEGLTIGLKQKPASDEAIVHTGSEDKNVLVGSTLLAINNYPVAALSYEETMERLTNSTWPITLTFRPPITTTAESMPLHELHYIENDNVRYQSLKRLLTIGVVVRKHNRSGSGFHASKIMINETRFFYLGNYSKAKNDAEIDACWKSISLYDLKFIRAGKVTKALKKRTVREDLCFSIELDNRPLDFEVPAEAEAAEDVAAILIWGIDRIIHETKSSQWFVDKEGVPTRRKNAKRLLTTV